MARLLLLLLLLVGLGACSREEAPGAQASSPALERAVSDVEAAQRDAATPPPLPSAPDTASGD